LRNYGLFDVGDRVMKPPHTSEQFYLTLPAIVRRVSDAVLGRVALCGLIGPLFLRAFIERFRFVPQLAQQGAFANGR
jgi:hypothetical protein